MSVIDYARRRQPQRFKDDLLPRAIDLRPCPLRTDGKRLFPDEGPHAYVWVWHRGDTVRLVRS